MKPRTSPLWNYFTDISKDTAKCMICERVYSRSGRSTTPLKSHLKSRHPDEYEQFCKLDEEKKYQAELSTSVLSSPQADRKRPVEDAIEMPLEEAIHMSLEETIHMPVEAVTIKEEPIWNTSRQTHEEIDKLIAEMLALQNLSFNFVEGVGFRRLIQAALPNYQLKGWQYYSSYICDEIYPRMSRKIQEVLKGFPKLSFTCDIWSEPNANVSLLCLTAHGITQDFCRTQIVLKCVSLHGIYTGSIICEKFKTMLSEWNINVDEVHCFIRDCGSSTTMHLDKITDVECILHQIQQCIRVVLDEQETYTNLITKCTQIANHFKHSHRSRDELKEIQEGHFNQPGLCVLQDCPTRLNSTFYMLERFTEIKDSLCLYARKNIIPQIFPEEWQHLDKFVSILKPFEETTREMSNSQTSISSVIPLIYVLKHTLYKQEVAMDDNPHFKMIVKLLIEQLSYRFGALENNNVYALATYLDPRYKLKFFNDMVKEQVQSQLLCLLMSQDEQNNDSALPSPSKKLKGTYNTNHNQPSTSVQEVNKPLSSIQSSLFKFLASSDKEENDDVITDRLAFLKRLMSEYNKEKRLKISEDPLLWWKVNTKYHSSTFIPIVRQFLSPPPGSIPREELFISDGTVCEPLGIRLEGENAAKILFIKYNLPLLQFDY